MTCGQGAELNCEQILERMHEFIDNELDAADGSQIRAHLEECAPCLQQIDFERLVKTVVARSCCERAPVELRQRVIFSIRQVHVQLTDGWDAPQ